MKQLTCFILDDEPMAVALLTDYVEKTPFLKLLGTTTSSLKALEMIHQQPVDLLFIDIQMPELSGIQLMEILGSSTKFIITSAYSEYALKGYEFNVIDYLMKPISFDRFYKSCLKAREIIAPTEEIIMVQAFEQPINFLFVKTDGKLVKIDLKDLLLVEGMKDYLMLHLTHEKLIVLETMKEFEKKLPLAQFMRVHKSYIVGLDHIGTIERNRIFINQKIIPIGETFKEHFHSWVQNLM